MSIPHIAGQLNNDLYALPVKRRQQQQLQQKSLDDIDTISPDKERSDESDLPPGWEKHEGTFIFRFSYSSSRFRFSSVLLLHILGPISSSLFGFSFNIETSTARFSQIILRTFSDFSSSRPLQLDVLLFEKGPPLNSLKIDCLETHFDWQVNCFF